ncbi:hypothetical protein [Myroides odoratimimus]|uniref:hypothetical protein n=1 Tax=Myroides odoratimimus TaxID=76832 RepID=UPI0025762FB1|nr:hypothetical protein [Myroides odoratimimus]MDM1465313.1 hypothetical protein [Myroides odoratimimus]MDM1475317.1 hypothetical protein [Myroides odoratimimus]
MNQLVYNQILEKNSSLYLSSIKSINNTKVKDEFKQYRKNSLYYLIKLNLERNKDQQSVEYKIFQFLDKNLDNILIGDVSKLIELNEQFSRLLLINYDYRFPEGKYSSCLLAEKLKIGEYSLYIKYYDTNDNDKPELLTLKSVLQNFLFKYSLLNSNNKKKHIISSIENRLCPFCSRNYINLIEGVTHNMGV